MELDELIRESAPAVGAAPAVGELRAGARRRRARNVRAAGVAVVVAVVAVLVPLLIPRDETNSTVAVRPHPVGRTLSTWSPVAPLPPDTDVSTTTQTELVATDGGVFVITHEERPDDTAANWVRVAQIDLASGDVTDLGYQGVRPTGTVFVAATGWQGGPALIVDTPAGRVVDHWANGSWEMLSLPAGPDLPANAGQVMALTVVGDDLVATIPLLGTIDPGFDGAVSEQAWSTGDGRTWFLLPAAHGVGAGSFAASGDTLVRQGFSPTTTGGSMTSILPNGADEWTEVPPPAFVSHGSLRSAEYDGVLVSCGTDELRFDCSRWSAGDGAQRISDPPPFRQGGWQEGRGATLQLLTVPGRGVLMSSGGALALYDPARDRWRQVPGPNGPGGAGDLLVVDGAVYGLASDGRPEFDAPPSESVFRLDVGADDHEVDPATDVGDGYRVRLPSERWTAGMGADDSGLSVGTADRVADGQGGECPALQVDFVEGTAPDAPSPYLWLVLPESTPPCTPTVFTTLGGGRQFTMRVYRSGPTTPDDATDLMEVIGSFRASSR